MRRRADRSGGDGPWAYRHNGRFYDALSFERAVYARGRDLGIERLALGLGDRVLDIGCGTGYSIPLLRRKVGESGVVVGVDASASMLARASAKVDPKWRLDLLEADARSLDDTLLRHLMGRRAPAAFDGAIACYALSTMADATSVVEMVWRMLAPGGRFVIVDLARPAGGFLGALAGLAAVAGGSDLDAHPWNELLRLDPDASSDELLRGHVHVLTGCRRST